jgi:hypothetical protein
MNPIINQRHETYWNLHKDVFSVRVKGRVVQHIRSAFVRNVTFAVQPAGRAKVLLEQRKNVHAFVRGDWMTPVRWEWWHLASDNPVCNAFSHLNDDYRVAYNPYKAGAFVSCITGDAIYKADRACLLIKDNKPEIYAWNISDKEL